MNLIKNGKYYVCPKCNSLVDKKPMILDNKKQLIQFFCRCRVKIIDYDELKKTMGMIKDEWLEDWRKIKVIK